MYCSLSPSGFVLIPIFKEFFIASSIIVAKLSFKLKRDYKVYLILDMKGISPSD